MEGRVKAVHEHANKKSAMWIYILGLFIGLLGFLGTFLFNQVAALPATYTTIEQHNRENDRQDRRQEIIEKKIDDGFQQIRELIIDLHKK